ncbi:EutN/CcmL family microcompartment protein [Bacillaceae bacterium Marseille-Q3522]|nr:EutN/CcmL family microcompartment protein [Bacillaceae bacterium Marseille-Q3522]
MYMAKVVGSIVATKKEESLTGKKLMIVQPINSKQQPIRDEEVAADFVGAGMGEYVLVARGSSARVIFEQPNTSIDAAIIGIIDSFDT